ncbi:MAG: glycosyltransferase family 2 protein [Candidatus Woesebacteria bacterium]|nr:MAG: glycosyltransferase family 2 protein [Candidatus Woesebacteria bacterium]
MTSIIIPTYNEKKSLGECIESLRKQSVSDFETVVIDDGSTDGTLEILRKFKKTIPNFRFAKQNHKGAGAARNFGAKFAKGQILVFVDADMMFDVNFLKKLVAPIESGISKGTFSKEEYVANWDNVWARYWNINEGWEPKRRHPKNYPDHQPVFRAILRTEFERVGGFTPGGYDDDWSLYKKLGYEAVNAPGAIFFHKNPDNLIEIYNHAKWVGKRTYKFGYLGYLGGLVRSSFPVSVVVGMYKGFKIHDLRFMIFKVVYDFGIFIGILEYLFTMKGAK